MAMTMNIQNVTKQYGSGETTVIAVRDVSFSIEPGEIVLIMGPSGSERRTFLSMLGGLLKPTSGTIELNGTILSSLTENRLPDIRLRQFGFIFQDFNLLSALSVLENVTIVAEMAGNRRSLAREKAVSLAC